MSGASTSARQGIEPRQVAGRVSRRAKPKLVPAVAAAAVLAYFLLNPLKYPTQPSQISPAAG
jgi:hypothetical protein